MAAVKKKRNELVNINIKEGLKFLENHPDKFLGKIIKQDGYVPKISQLVENKHRFLEIHDKIEKLKKDGIIIPRELFENDVGDNLCE